MVAKVGALITFAAAFGWATSSSSVVHADVFWTRPVADTAARDRFVAVGDRHLDDASRAASYNSVFVPPYIAESARVALRAYERALAIGPESGELHYRAIMASRIVIRQRGICRDCRDVYEAFLQHAEAFHRLQPFDVRELDLTLEVAVAASKLGGLAGPDQDAAYEMAIAAYEKLRRMAGTAVEPDGLATSYSNEAEIFMALGRLEEAQRSYRTAVDLAPFEPLNWFGLAVAYDRDHQWTKAVEAMRRGLGHAPGLEKLDDTRPGSDVFFVPDGDGDYYRGLGHQVLGNYVVAKDMYTRFLARCKASRYLDRAREHLAELAQIAPQ